VKSSFRHLGPFSDLVAAASRHDKLFPLAKPGKKTQQLVHRALAFDPWPATPRDVKLGRRWTRDGVDGEEISWSVGFGPRTKAWLLRPASRTGKLPGVVALHDHGAFKFYGKEKVADGPDPMTEVIRRYRAGYGGRAFANELARRGFAVLVHDTFLWGSRKFPVETLPDFDRLLGRLMARGSVFYKWTPRKIAEYNGAAIVNEHTLARYCLVMGISQPGIINFDDRVAVNVLASRRDVDAGNLGCVGFSGGGFRAVLLQATCPRIRVSVAGGCMCTYEEMFDHCVDNHAWLGFLPAWAQHGEWPDVAACRAPSPLMVVNCWADGGCTVPGIKAAHRRIAAHYKSVGKPENYKGAFYTGQHRFDIPMQDAAFEWMERRLKR